MIVSFPSAALVGVDATRVDVEVDVALGLPGHQVVGLAATAVKEGASRIRAAIRACGIELPSRKVTVNLAPADVRKDGAAYDLPIALGEILASGTADRDGVLQGLLMLGELGLDGTVRSVRGVLAAARLARDLGLRGVLVPRARAAEASVIEGIEVYGIEHLAEVLRAISGDGELPRWTGGPPPSPPPPEGDDLSDVRGQVLARRAVEIAMAGGHNVLLYGPPGVGRR